MKHIFQVRLHKLARVEVRRGCVSKIFETLSESALTHAHNLDDLFLCSVEAVHSRGNKQCSAADTRRSTTNVNPVPFHLVNHANGDIGNLSHFFTEVELRRKSVDVQRRVDQRDVLDAQSLDQTHESFPNTEHVHVENIRKVEQHVRQVVLSAHYVQTRSDHLRETPSLSETVCDCELVDIVRTVYLVASKRTRH